MCGDCGGMQKESDRLRGDTSKDSSRQAGAVNQCCARPGGVQPQVNSCVGDYERHLHEDQMKDGICANGPKEPYQIPGYAGHVQSLQSRSGGTYGHDTHEAILSNGLAKTTQNKADHVCPTPLHEPYHLPGYTGHVPGLDWMVGGTYGQDSHKALLSIQPYPNRQENLSPARPSGLKQNFGDGPASIHTEVPSTQQTKLQTGYAAASSEPYQIPEQHYLKPQLKYRISDSYATRADVTLVDPCVNQESTTVVSTRQLDDTQVVRTQKTLEDKVQDFPYIYQPLRHRPMVPGFDAYIDALRGARGQSYEFNSPPSHQQLQQQLILQEGSVKKPQRNGRLVGDDDQKYSNLDVHKEGELPYGYGNYGYKQKYTNSALYDFAANYRQRQSTEWAPATMSRPDPPALDVPGELYSQHTGLLPGYTGHVPGALFRSGKNFTDDSRDARRALRGDRF